MQTIYKILDFRCKNLNRAQVYFTHPFYKIDEWDLPFPTLFTPTSPPPSQPSAAAFPPSGWRPADVGLAPRGPIEEEQGVH